MKKDREELEILRFLYQERKWLVISVFCAALVALVATSFMDKKFRSTATVFPPGFNSADRMLENPQFGYNIEADRLIQIGESINLKDSVIQYFNLMEYYNIDPSSPVWKTELLSKYEKDIQFERTKYMSVRISVLNRDPNQAAAMVEEIMALLSRFWERLFKNNMHESLNYAQKRYADKQREVSNLLDSIHLLRGRNSDRSIQIYKRQMDEKQKEVEQCMSQLSALRSKGEFYDYGTKIELIAEEILLTNRMIELEKAKLESLEAAGKKNDSAYYGTKARYEGAMEHKHSLDESMKSLKESGKSYQILNQALKLAMEQYDMAKMEYEKLLYSFEPLVESVELDYLEARYKSERNALSVLKEKFEKAHRYYNEPLPNLFVIESPRPIFQKASPSYFLNIGITSMTAFIACIVFLLTGRSLIRVRQELNS